MIRTSKNQRANAVVELLADPIRIVDSKNIKKGLGLNNNYSTFKSFLVSKPVSDLYFL